jgi:flagellar biosynthesis GTPase FlhF
MRALGEPIQQAKWRAPEDRAIDVKHLFYLFLLLQNNLYEPIFSNKSTLLPIFARILALPLMAKLSPEARARLEAFKAIKVKHPRLEDVDRQVTQAIEEHAGYTHLLVYGPSGVGKSTVTRRIAERFVMEETNRAIVPVVWVEARPSDTGVYARLDYYRQVLHRCVNMQR